MLLTSKWENETFGKIPSKKEFFVPSLSRGTHADEIAAKHIMYIDF